MKIVTIFGGTGFIGRQIVRELATAGYFIKVATRAPARAYFLKPCGSAGQIVPFACDYNDERSVMAAVRDADVVVNCIGILYQRRKSKFDKVHTDIPAMIAKACKKAKVNAFIHLSALGLESDKSKYAETKIEGEKAAKKAFPATIILRQGLVFGPEDRFFNRFAELSRYLPFLPLIGGGKTKFQPVYVGDVADAVMALLSRLNLQETDPRGKTYELGGPRIVTFRKMMERMFSCTGRHRMLIPLPWRLAKMQASFLSLLPNPLLTPDQVESLKTDHVVSEGALTFEDLGIRPNGMDLILPDYLQRYRSGGKADILVGDRNYV